MSLTSACGNIEALLGKRRGEEEGGGEEEDEWKK